MQRFMLEHAALDCHHGDSKTIDMEHWQNLYHDILELTKYSVNPLTISNMCQAVSHKVVVAQTHSLWCHCCFRRKWKYGKLIGCVKGWTGKCRLW